MKMNQLAEALSALFLRFLNILVLVSLEVCRSVLLMKKNSEASAPQLFSSGNSIIAGFSSISIELSKRTEKQNCSCITRQFCCKVCNIYAETEVFLCLTQ